MTVPTQPMTVVRLLVDSYKRIRAADVSPDATGLVLVRGRNDQGKSSLIDSMLAALLGRKGVQELPITEGAHGADVVLDLGEIVIRRHWSRDSAGDAKSELEVTAKDGSTLRSPQGVLDNLVGHFADPVAFLAMKPEEQAATFLRCIGKADDVTRLERAASEAYERRRDVGRDADRLTKTLAELSREVDGLPPAPTTGTVSELTAQLQQAKDHNANRAAAIRARDVELERGKEARTLVERLEAKLAETQAQLEHARSRLEQTRAAWTTADAAAQGLVEIPVQPIVDALAAHELAAKHAARRELLENTRVEAFNARQLHAQAELDLEATREAMRQLFAGVDFGMPVQYDSENRRLLLDGIPLAQSSTSQRLKFAAAVAMRGAPMIRVLFVRDGSVCDEQRRAELAELAEASGFQVWFEMVDSERDGVGIWIEDGQAYQP